MPDNSSDVVCMLTRRSLLVCRYCNAIVCLFIFSIYSQSALSNKHELYNHRYLVNLCDNKYSKSCQDALKKAFIEIETPKLIEKAHIINQKFLEESTDDIVFAEFKSLYRRILLWNEYVKSAIPYVCVRDEVSSAVINCIDQRNEVQRKVFDLIIDREQQMDDIVYFCITRNIDNSLYQLFIPPPQMDILDIEVHHFGRFLLCLEKHQS